jgi:hypothetical protein
MKNQFRFVSLTGLMCFVVGVAASWVGHAIVNASGPQAKTQSTTETPLQAAASSNETPSLSEKNDQHIKIADRTKSYLAIVTSKNALKVDASEAPISRATTNGVSGDLPENTVSPDLGYPRALTMCWDTDSVTVYESFDGKTWFPNATAIATGTKSIGLVGVGMGCMSVPPARFVKWSSQGMNPKADGMYQVAY